MYMSYMLKNDDRLLIVLYTRNPLGGIVKDTHEIEPG